MRFILKTAYLLFLCLFFAVNIYGQKTTKKVIQTFSPEERVQFLKIDSENDSTYALDRWEGKVIWIQCTIEAEGINTKSIDSYKAKYEKLQDVITLELDTGKPLHFKNGKEIEVKVTYEIFIPNNTVTFNLL